VNQSAVSGGRPCAVADGASGECVPACLAPDIERHNYRRFGKLDAFLFILLLITLGVAFCFWKFHWHCHRKQRRQEDKGEREFDSEEFANPVSDDSETAKEKAVAVADEKETEV
jgi:heme/copper-type cytochrome/quinol oxidase subunit 2